MKIQNLDDVLADELKDIYSLEQQLIKVLAKMSNAADGDLRTAFEEHIEQTHTHADRIQQICDQLKNRPEGKKCAGIEGIVMVLFHPSLTISA
jgi:ferritin-like metal-binding protein YciE